MSARARIALPPARLFMRVWLRNKLICAPPPTALNDILCPSPVPSLDNGATQGTNKSGNPTMYAYNDGDGSTAYDVEYPLQIHGFDPNFHFVGMTFNPEGFADMKDKYFLLNGRSYPDTIHESTYVDGNNSVGGNSVYVGQPTKSNAIYTQASDSVSRASQPLNAVINIPVGGKALLRHLRSRRL